MKTLKTMRMMKTSQTMKTRLLLQLFISFFKIGPVTFGGGYAMIPLIEKEVVEKRKWIELDELTDVFAVSQSVPGAIAINASTFIGYRLAGIFGAIVAMIGVLLPTFLIVILLSVFFLQVQHHPKIEAAFMAIRPTIVALITYAAIRIGRSSAVDKTSLILTVLTVGALLFLPVHPIFLLILGALVGMAIKKLQGRKKQDFSDVEFKRGDVAYTRDMEYAADVADRIDMENELAVEQAREINYKYAGGRRDKRKTVPHRNDDYFMGEGI